MLGEVRTLSAMRGCLEMATNAKTPAFSSQRHEEGRRRNPTGDLVSSEENQVSVKSRSYKECSLKNLGVKDVY